MEKTKTPAKTKEQTVDINAMINELVENCLLYTSRCV